MLFINNTSWDTISQANHCAACVYRRKTRKYERSADRQSAEITAYPTFIMLSAILLISELVRLRAGPRRSEDGGRGGGH